MNMEPIDETSEISSCLLNNMNDLIFRSIVITVTDGKNNLLGGDGIFREELCKNLHHLATVEHTFGAEVSAGGGGILVNKDVGKCHIPNVHVCLNRISISLCRAC